MVFNLLVLIIELWLLAALVVYLHRLSPRFGLTPFLIYLGMLMTMVRVVTLFQPFVRASPTFVFGLTGNVLVPLVVFSVLLIYIVQGTSAARTVIVSGLLLDILFTLMIVSIRAHIGLPGGVSFTGITPDDAILQPRLTTTAASSTAFFIDLLVVIIAYQALQNRASKLPEWLRTGLTLMTALAINSITFSTLDFLLGGSDFERFISRLPGRVLGQIISAVLLLPVAAYYLSNVVPRLPDYAGRHNRPTLDVIFGSQRTIERELLEARTQLESREKAYEELADEISHTTHDLKSPLTSIRLRLYTLARTDDPLKQVQLIQKAETQVDTLSELIDNLLMLSRLSETADPDTKPVNINDLAAEVFTATKPIADDKQQSLSIKQTQQSLMVSANSTELSRAFTNLIVNASQYTPEGGTIEIETIREKDCALFKVRDSGRGIDPDHMERIWDRYYRIETPSGESSGNVGLGLTIVRQIVERHAGQIFVESTPGQGTTFTIELDLLPADTG